jgi:hypothetical protein
MSEPSQKQIIMPPPPLVALAAWLVPGAGYVLIGQRVRGIVVGITILLIFVAGLLIGGMHVVDAPTALSPPVLFQKPWFIGQVMAGPVTMAANYIANHWTTGAVVGVPMSHARVYEIGVLYTAVAGMLNLMAIIDAAYRSSNEGAR